MAMLNEQAVLAHVDGDGTKKLLRALLEHALQDLIGCPKRGRPP